MAESDDNSQKLSEDAIPNIYAEEAARKMKDRLWFLYMYEKIKNEEEFMSDILPCSLGLLALNPSNCEFVKKILTDRLEAGWRMSFSENNLRERMAEDKEYYDKFNMEDAIYNLGGGEYYADFNIKDGVYSFKLWWIILLRFYIQQTKDDTILEPEVKKEVLAIVECLLGNSDRQHQLWKIKCSNMLEPKTFMFGPYPIEGQATLYFSLKCALELMNLPQFEDGQTSIGQKLTSMKQQINKQITRMDFLISKHYWVDNSKVANSRTAPLRGGFYQYGMWMKSTKWSLKGNCIAILSSLATPQQAEAIMNFIEKYWAQVIENLPQSNEYCVDKDESENFHGVLWLLVATSIKARKVEVAKRAIEVFEKQCPPSKIDLQDGKSIKNWRFCGYFVSKILIENDSMINKFSFEKASASNIVFFERFELIKKHFEKLWGEIERAYAEWLVYCGNTHLQKICQQLGTHHGIDSDIAREFLKSLPSNRNWKPQFYLIGESKLHRAFFKIISQNFGGPLGGLLHENSNKHCTLVKNNFVMVWNLALKMEPLNIREHLLEFEDLHIPIPRCERFWMVVEERLVTGMCLDCNHQRATKKLPCGDEYLCEECFDKSPNNCNSVAVTGHGIPYSCVLCDPMDFPYW